jgi:hypothetical protein
MATPSADAKVRTDIPPEMLLRGPAGEAFHALGQEGVHTALVVAQATESGAGPPRELILLMLYDGVALSPVSERGLREGWLVLMRRPALSGSRPFEEEGGQVGDGISTLHPHSPHHLSPFCPPTAQRQAQRK